MKFKLIILILLFPAISVAQTYPLTLKQLMSIAMEKNRDIEKAREYAVYLQGRYVEERAAALPSFSLNGTAMLSKDKSQSVSGIAAQRQFGRVVDLTLSQPLYTWGKLNAAIRAAEVGLKTADQQLRLYRQAVYRDVATAYYDILLAKDLLRLAKENNNQKKRHLDEAKRKLEAGVATDYDVLAAEVAQENSIPEIIRAENNFRLSLERLGFLMAFETKEFDVAGTLDAPEMDNRLPKNHEEALETALKQRPELLDMRLRLGIYDELVTIANAENKPRLDLKGGAGWHWLSLDDPPPSADADGLAWNFGIYFTFPFFDGLKTSGKITQAKSELHTKHIEEKKLLEYIALEVRQAEFLLSESTKIYYALTGTVKQAERLLQMAEKGYELGVKIRLEVEDAQLNLLQARSNLARAERDCQVAQIGYLWAVGIVGE